MELCHKVFHRLMFKNSFEIRIKQIYHAFNMCNSVINIVVQHDESQFSMLFAEWVCICVCEWQYKVSINYHFYWANNHTLRTQRIQLLKLYACSIWHQCIEGVDKMLCGLKFLTIWLWSNSSNLTICILLQPCNHTTIQYMSKCCI